MKEGEQEAKQKLLCWAACCCFSLARCLPQPLLLASLFWSSPATEEQKRDRVALVISRLIVVFISCCLLLAARCPRFFFIFFSSRYGFLFVCFSLLDLIITVLFLFFFLSYKLAGSRLRFWCVSGCLCSKIFGYS